MKSKRFATVFAALYTLFFLVLYFPPFVGIEARGAFSHIHNSWQDFLFTRSSALKPGDPRLILIAIDDDSGKKYGFPLPRKLYAQALDKLQALGVRTAVFDVMFLESREGDAELAAATKRFGRVVHLFVQEVQEVAAGAVVQNRSPVAPLLKSTKYLGHPNVESLIDPDGHLRRFELFRLDVADPYREGFDSISLDAAALAAHLDLSFEEVREKFGGGVQIINHRPPRTWLQHEKRDQGKSYANVPTIESAYRRISLLDILSGELSADQRAALKGSIVMFGSTALGYYDHYPTPFVESGPGVEFHMNVLDNMLNGDPMTSWSRLATILLIIVMIWLTYALYFLPPLVGTGSAIALLGVWAGFCSWQFGRGNVVEFVPPAVAMLSSYLVLSVHKMLTEGAEKKMIKGMFGQFVSPEVVEELANNPDKAKLGAQKREMTVFFLDIAHFTTISEKMGPEALIAFLNKYLSALSDVILERRGTIDKYIGDCIMAFWNAPTENPHHAREAILSALGCQRVIDELNKDLDPGLPEIPAIRIGINTGLMNVGFTGTQRKLAYTVLGDEVNLASRLEGANKFFGSKIIASEPAYNDAKDVVEGRYLGKARVVGKATPVPVYEPLAEKGKLTPEWAKALPVWEKSVKSFYEKKYDAALSSFEEFLRLMPGDGPGELYLNLSRDYAALPPDDWDQVFNLTAK